MWSVSPQGRRGAAGGGTVSRQLLRKNEARSQKEINPSSKAFLMDIITSIVIYNFAIPAKFSASRLLANIQ